jgi:ribosomal protein L7/L12
LLHANNKIGAIKLYRERTRVGLKDAKEAVEAIEGGADPQVIAMARAVHKVPESVDLAQVQALLRTGNKIEAIKLYRMAAGLSLKEAKDAVEAIAASTPGVPAHLASSGGRGCPWNVALVIVTFVVCLFGGCGTYAQTTGTYRCVIDEVKRGLTNSEVLGSGVDAGYLVLSPSYSQSFDLDGSWGLSMDLFAPAWGNRGVGLLYMSARADYTGYTAMRVTLWKDWQRHELQGWGTVDCK